MVAILSFLFGAAMGAMLMLLYGPLPRVRKVADKVRFSLPFVKHKQVQAPKDYPVAPISRVAGSWRKQKAELERQHNSRQRERDQRIASI